MAIERNIDITRQLTAAGFDTRCHADIPAG
jgi:hypothetical protein